MIRSMAMVAATALVVCVLGCDRDSPGSGAEAMPDPPPVELQETPEQTAMRHAVEKARETVGELIDDLRVPLNKPRTIEVKAIVQDPASGVSEVLPLREVTYSDGRLHGKIDATPLLLESIARDQPYDVAPEMIFDWHIIEGTTIRGGYTLRAARQYMTPDERKQFDEDLGVVFD